MSLRSTVAGQARLFHYPGLRRLFWATLISSTGTWLALVALAIDIFDRTHSSVWVGALFVTETLPIALLGFFLGPILDRLPRRSVMIASDLFRAVVFLALVLAPNAWAIIGLATLAGIATGLFTPAVYAGLPNLVDEGDLASANGLFQTAGSATQVIGPLGGGILVATLGPHPAYLVNTASFVLSALFIAMIRPEGLQVRLAASPRGYLQDLCEGARAIVRSRSLLTVFIAWNVAMIGLAASNTTEVELVKQSFGAGDFGYGMFVAAIGLGILVGALSARTLFARLRLASIYGLAILVLALGDGLVALLPPLALAITILLVVGSGNGLLLTANGMLVQRGAPDELRGRSFTTIMSANALVFTVASLGAGLLADRTSARFVWAVAAIVLAITAVVAWLLARPLSVEPGSASEERLTVEPLVELPAGSPLGP
jgi:MFS family permease